MTPKRRALRFNEQHDRRYGHAAPDQSIEMVNLRLVVTVPRMQDVIGRWLSAPWTPDDAAPEQRRPVVLDDPRAPARGAHPVAARASRPAPRSSDRR